MALIYIHTCTCTVYFTGKLFSFSVASFPPIYCSEKHAITGQNRSSGLLSCQLSYLEHEEHLPLVSPMQRARSSHDTTVRLQKRFGLQMEHWTSWFVSTFVFKEYNYDFWYYFLGWHEKQHGSYEKKILKS